MLVSRRQTDFLGFLNGQWSWSWSACTRDVGYIPLLFFRKWAVIIEALNVFMPTDLHNMSRRYLVVVQPLDHFLHSNQLFQPWFLWVNLICWRALVLPWTRVLRNWPLWCGLWPSKTGCCLTSLSLVVWKHTGDRLVHDLCHCLGQKKIFGLGTGSCFCLSFSCGQIYTDIQGAFLWENPNPDYCIQKRILGFFT